MICTFIREDFYVVQSRTLFITNFIYLNEILGSVWSNELVSVECTYLNMINGFYHTYENKDHFMLLPRELQR